MALEFLQVLIAQENRKGADPAKTLDLLQGKLEFYISKAALPVK